MAETARNHKPIKDSAQRSSTLGTMNERPFPRIDLASSKGSEAGCGCGERLLRPVAAIHALIVSPETGRCKPAVESHSFRFTQSFLTFVTFVQPIRHEPLP